MQHGLLVRERVEAELAVIAAHARVADAAERQCVHCESVQCIECATYGQRASCSR